MKKRMLWCLAAWLLVCVLAACGSKQNRPEDESGFHKKVWTQDELKQVNNKEEFVPKSPQKERFVLVVSPENKLEESGQSELSEAQTERQIASLFQALQEMNPNAEPEETETAQFLTPDEQRMREDALRAAGVDPKEKDDSPIEMKMTANPNNARVKIVYRHNYVSGGSYMSGGRIATAFINELILEAYDLTTGEEIARVAVKKKPGDSITVTAGTTRVYMKSPDFEKPENITALYRFIRDIQSALNQQE